MINRAAFLSQYRDVREREGYRVGARAYYRALPWTRPADPHRAVWQIRRRSFEQFRSLAKARFAHTTPAVLDLGAGNCWLSYRLTLEGWRVVAVDIFDDNRDGLRAAEHYDVRFPRVQADFDALPFARRCCDAVVFNGSLHYAPDVRATLERAAALLSRGGIIAVIDSPMFDCPAAGAGMRQRSIARFQRDFHIANPVVPGEGFLWLPAMADTARALGLTASFFESSGGMRWTLNRWLNRARHRAQPARFGVWWAA